MDTGPDISVISSFQNLPYDEEHGNQIRIRSACGSIIKTTAQTRSFNAKLPGVEITFNLFIISGNEVYHNWR